MDATSLYLLNKFQSGTQINTGELAFVLIGIPLIVSLINYIKNIKSLYLGIIKWFETNIKKYKYITFRATMNLSYDGVVTTHIPPQIVALSWYIKQNINVKYNSTYFIEDFNGYDRYKIRNNIANTSINFIIKELPSYTKLKDNIDILVNFENNNIVSGHIIETIEYTLRTKNGDANQILDEIMAEYKKYKSNIHANKTYHFIYQGDSKWVVNMLNDYTASKMQIFETFDNTFHDYIDRFKRDIDRLRDIDYFEYTGMKRKLGYLLYGKPGCGKTSSVMAMSNYDKRHIIEISLKRITKLSELEFILSCKEISGIPFNLNNVILLFDEIDTSIFKSNNTKIPVITLNQPVNEDNKQENTEENKQENKETIQIQSNQTATSDKITLGTFLSRLDGIGNYNGLIIVATTNYIDKLDPAIYRSLRLTPLKFDYPTPQMARKIVAHHLKTHVDSIKMKNFEKKNPDLFKGDKSAADIKFMISDQ
jgi:chaperone BCS1